MPLTYETAERLFQLGQFSELVASTDITASGVTKLGFRHAILVAHALAQTGDIAAARRLADYVDRNGHPMLRSRVQLVRGIVSESCGFMSEAKDRFQTAVRLALLARDDHEIAWAYLRLLRHLIDTSSTSVVAGMLPEVRKAVTSAANVHATAYLHQCVSVFEGQLGRSDEARRHCDMVDSLLSGAPNAWLAAGNLVNRTCLALVECNFSEAAKYLSDSKLRAPGVKTRLSAFEHNLAYFQITTGQFDEALLTLERITRSARGSRLGLIGVFDAQARVHLALNVLGRCEAALGQIEREIVADRSLAQFFTVRWSVITKARLHLKRNRPDAAWASLRRAEESLSEVDDVPLKALMKVTSAQALVSLGRPEDAATQILQANRWGITGFRELQGQYYYACALMFDANAAARAERMKRRALSLWKAQGIVSLPLEMDTAVPSSASDSGDDTPKSGAGLTANPVDALAIDAAAAVLDLAHTPAAMASELLALVRGACSERAELVQSPAGHAAGHDADGTVAIPVGPHRNTELAIVCPVPPTPDKAATLAAVMRIAEAAVALERARREERNRAALWPEDPVEEQAGALFVAEDMQALLATARRVAPTTVSVLITGETGTGKEVLARTIHAYSDRSKGTFLPFNCTSIPRDMLDSQLFGHRRGAFTGATEHFQGVIRAAAGGTLFLDEIGDMPADVQPKLLRFLESGEVHPIGETRPVRADVRVVAATNANLDAFVTDGRFREDLFYRLNIVRLHLPPLRERRVEIPALAVHYLRKYAQEYAKGDLRLAEETMEYLLLYRWPGNVRQLANEMRRMAALSEPGAILMPEHLSHDIAASRRTIPPSERTLDPHEVVVRMDQPMAAATAHLERAMLQYALHKTGGRMEETAALLGLSRKGLYLKRQRYGIDRPGEIDAGAA